MSEDAALTVFWHDDCLDHGPPDGEFEHPWTGRLADPEPHPDRPERLRNIRRIIESVLAAHAPVTWEAARRASRSELERLHDPGYIREFREFCADGGGRITPTTGVDEASYPAARRAAGGAIQAATAALEGDALPYALVRPSGHHAQADTADGFCFFNNAALAVEHAVATGLADRVAVVDWDVHHGNGTQDLFYGREDVLVVNLHNDHGAWDPETHPQTGGVEERGSGDGVDYNVNVPLPPGTGDRGYEYVFERLVEPVVSAFDPDLLVASAGGDPGTVEPHGRNLLTKNGFVELGRRAADLADGSLAVVQEGGYQPSHLAYAQLGVLEGALGVDTGVEDPMPWLPEKFEQVRPYIDESIEAHADAWPVG